MLRVTNTLKNLTKDAFNTNYSNYQTVRWRKPRWVPQAKSKIFRIPTKPIIPEEEKVELMRLYNNYRTHIKSIRRYLTYKYCVRYLASEDPEEQKRIFQEDHLRCVEINKEWNEKQRVVREKHVADKLEADLAFANKRIELELLKEETRLQEIEEIVRKEKEQAQHYITAMNIDAALDHALANPIDHNFAINLSGEKVSEGQSGPDEVKQKANVNN